MRPANTPKDIGSIIREKRKNDRLTQAELAGICGVGIRLISEIENGKATTQIAKVLQVLGCLGLVMRVTPKDKFVEK